MIKSFFNRYIITIVLFLVFIIVVVVLYNISLFKIGSDFTKAYAQIELFMEAQAKAAKNDSVILLLGEIEPMDKLSILEGEVKYSTQYDTLTSTTRIIGSKGKARLDIKAILDGDQWIFESIKVRLKDPKLCIIVLDTSQ